MKNLISGQAKIEYVANGRFDFPTVWIDNLQSISEVDYRDSLALNIGNALGLWAGLTSILVQAGQGGVLDAKLSEQLTA